MLKDEVTKCGLCERVAVRVMSLQGEFIARCMSCELMGEAAETKEKALESHDVMARIEIAKELNEKYGEE